MTNKDVMGFRTFKPKRYPALLPIVSCRVNDPQSLADRVRDHILRRITNGELSGGSKLKSTELAESLNMSRTPVAKALAILTVDGILEQPNNHQAIVVPGTENWLSEIHVVQQLLEPEAASRAAGNVEPDVLEDLELLAEDSAPGRSRSSPQADRYFDFALHLSIAEYCGLFTMKVLLQRYWSYKRVTYSETGMDKEFAREKRHDQHLAILNAISNGDSSMARAEMINHLSDEGASFGAAMSPLRPGIHGKTGSERKAPAGKAPLTLTERSLAE